MNKFKPDPTQALGRRSSHQNPEAARLQAALAEEETKRLHAHIPASLHRKLKKKAAGEDRGMKELVIEALTMYLGS